MCLYFLNKYMAFGKIPKDLVDVNIASDYTKLGKMLELCKAENKTEILEKTGLQVLRFSNADVNENLTGVCQSIDFTVKARMCAGPERGSGPGGEQRFGNARGHRGAAAQSAWLPLSP